VRERGNVEMESEQKRGRERQTGERKWRSEREVEGTKGILVFGA